ncbi:hypothetical protein EIN_223730 [Entamoeba invadens IP1]|uniref:HMG box domain-containing protein n=1 Tax=Entamoeba invadens IP1 TaxID=370355 RepID=A0A0A1U5M7_ENTIV|nr:hypothetical protein EIN_223730 [Entamoeba invadens IP1]ELP88160.1 hypothetical protein EIN_223730 [Entamoeba invadens IP1]|eukprot:XP_004254931.1 hypothetical protein EIN_223730 [Entamoeba invadens IP1]
MPRTNVSSSSSSSDSSDSSSDSSSSFSPEQLFNYSRTDKKQKKKDKEKKPRKEGVREMKKRKKEELANISREIYEMFVKRTLISGGMTESEAMLKIEKKWKKAGSEVKKTFEQLAFIECSLIGDLAVMKKKRKADTSRRKEEWHPYLLFCKMNRESLSTEGISGSTVMKKLSDTWKTLPETEKAKYCEMAKENKKRDLELEGNKSNVVGKTINIATKIPGGTDDEVQIVPQSVNQSTSIKPIDRIEEVGMENNPMEILMDGFTIEKVPVPSNFITEISIDDKNGEKAAKKSVVKKIK